MFLNSFFVFSCSCFSDFSVFHFSCFQIFPFQMFLFSVFLLSIVPVFHCSCLPLFPFPVYLCLCSYFYMFLFSRVVAVFQHSCFSVPALHCSGFSVPVFRCYCFQMFLFSSVAVWLFLLGFFLDCSSVQSVRHLVGELSLQPESLPCLARLPTGLNIFELV